ncbi:Non-histone protein 10 [Echria macrotheca]|uniref:Non-histone protein 10 n=1 Tax=Echria macrotheca TaxID=438768 RepID=A0AAJ0FC90_9PEZI|nr:Non-histone protein 10 [Echria macrotheca]
MAPATSTPPALPPSVEEAYRRKCIQLKQRVAEVEEANDAARLRLARMKRQVEKMRLERAFLLEQLAKRTSSNVEDSDGSPSPPPTVRSSPRSSSMGPFNHQNPRLNNSSTTQQPKEKPLRIKRGHRKPSALPSFDTPGGAAAASGGGQNNAHSLAGHSPSSEAFSTQPGERANGTSSRAPTKPGTAFDLYCDEARAKGKSKGDGENGDSPEDEQQLRASWKDLAESRREEFEARADDEMAKYEKEKSAYDDAKAAAAAASKSSNNKESDETEMDIDANDRREVSASAKAAGETPTAQDQDVEMGNYDTDQETQGEKAEE